MTEQIYHALRLKAPVIHAGDKNEKRHTEALPVLHYILIFNQVMILYII